MFNLAHTMKKALLYFSLILSISSCVEKEELNIPKELVGTWEKEFETAADSWNHTLVFKFDGTYESFSYRSIQTSELQTGYLSHNIGDFSEIDGNLVLSNTRSFFAEDYSNPPSEIGLLKEQLEWVIPNQVAEFSLEANDTLLVLTFLGCNDVVFPTSLANCAPPTPMAYNKVVVP
jgi:hypothetical protein